MAACNLIPYRIGNFGAGIRGQRCGSYRISRYRADARIHAPADESRRHSRLNVVRVALNRNRLSLDRNHIYAHRCTGSVSYNSLVNGIRVCDRIANRLAECSGSLMASRILIPHCICYLCYSISCKLTCADCIGSYRCCINRTCCERCSINGTICNFCGGDSISSNTSCCNHISIDSSNCDSCGHRPNRATDRCHNLIHINIRSRQVLCRCWATNVRPVKSSFPTSANIQGKTACSRTQEVSDRPNLVSLGCNCLSSCWSKCNSV